MKKKVLSMLLVLVMMVSVTSIIVPASAKKVNFPSVSSSKPIRAYTLQTSGRVYPYKSKTSSRLDYSHWINCATDECKIIGISGNRVNVIYPTAKGPSQPRWFPLSAFFNVRQPDCARHWDIEQDTYPRYLKYDKKYGYIEKGDYVYLLSYDESMFQVIYPVRSGGYKAAWCFYRTPGRYVHRSYNGISCR